MNNFHSCYANTARGSKSEEFQPYDLCTIFYINKIVRMTNNLVTYVIEPAVFVQIWRVYLRM